MLPYLCIREGEGDIVFGADSVSVDIGMTLSCVQDIPRTSGWIQHLGMMKTFLYPPQTLFVGGILFSRCPCVRPCVRPSVRLSVRPSVRP